MRDALVRAALALIDQSGSSALSLRRVARQAGVSHAAPYAHFVDKEDLISAVKDEGFKLLESRIEAALAADDDPPHARLSRVARVYLDFVAEQPAMYEIMFRRPLAQPSAGATHIAAGQRIFMTIVRELERMAEQRARPLRSSPELAAITAWSAVHGLSMLWIDGPLTYVGPKQMSYTQLQEAFVEHLLNLLET